MRWATASDFKCSKVMECVCLFVSLLHFLRIIFMTFYILCVLFVISSIPWLGQKELTDVIPHRRNLCALCYYLLSTNRVSRNAKSRTNFRPTEKKRPDQPTYNRWSLAIVMVKRTWCTWRSVRIKPKGTRKTKQKKGNEIICWKTAGWP